MKVLHILNSSRLSGAENVAAEIITSFKHKIEMAYASPSGDISQALLCRGINYLPLKQLSKQEIRRVIEDYKPDIIHAHDIRASVQAARVNTRIPIISHIHGNHNDMKSISLKSILYLLCLRRFDHVIAVSDSVVNEYVFSKQLSSRCTVLYNVVDKDRIQENIVKDKQSYKYDFVFLGRLAYPKNPQRVVTIAAKVCKRLPNVRFGIIGDGNLRKTAEEIVDLEGISDNVTFCGYLTNPYKALSEAKALLMCSEFEGTPMAVLEAMLLGIPVVSTPVDGVKDIIVNGQEGFLSNDDNDLVDSIVRLIVDKNLQQFMSSNVKKKAELINNIEEYKSKILTIYDKCLINH